MTFDIRSRIGVADGETVDAFAAFASAVALKDIDVGEKINKKNCTFKRPGDGDFLARDYKKLFGKISKVKIKANQQIKKKFV